MPRRETSAHGRASSSWFAVRFNGCGTLTALAGLQEINPYIRRSRKPISSVACARTTRRRAPCAFLCSSIHDSIAVAFTCSTRMVPKAGTRNPSIAPR